MQVLPDKRCLRQGGDTSRRAKCYILYSMLHQRTVALDYVSLATQQSAGDVLPLQSYKPCHIFRTVRIIISRHTRTFGLSLPKRERNVIATDLLIGQTPKAFASYTVEFVLIKKYNTPEYH
jgi:hypothetical protein